MTSSRFAPEASNASTASSSERCPRGSPSSSPRSSVASQTNRSASRAASTSSVRGRRVARVREHGAVRLHAERVGLKRVVGNPGRRDGELADRERRVGLVLRELERALEHVRESETFSKAGQELGSARLHPERRLLLGAVGSEVERAPDPRDEIAPVVEMEVRDRDRVDLGPRRLLAEPTQYARPAVEEHAAPVCLEHVAGMCATGVRPRRRGADDVQAHRGILPMCRARYEW